MAFKRVILIYKSLFLGFLDIYSADLNFIDKEHCVRELFFNIVSGFNKLLGLLVDEII
jgi:hypothetical protein